MDAFLANSENVRERIARIYGRPSRVVPAPADTAFYTPAPSTRPREGLLVVSALAPYKRPRQLVVVASLPRNPTGKLDKRALRLSLSPTAGRGTES